MPPPVDIAPTVASVTKDGRKPRTPRRSEVCAAAALHDIVREYTQKIAELSRLTDELPQRLCFGDAEEAGAQRGAGIICLHRIATLDSMSRPFSAAVALPFKHCPNDVVHPEDEVGLQSSSLSVRRNDSETNSRIEYSSDGRLLLNSSENDADTMTRGPSTSDPSGTWRMASSSVLLRLQARLGVQDWNSTLTAQQIHTAVTCLGLEKYTLRNVEKLVMRIMRVSPVAQAYEHEGDSESGPAALQFLVRRATKDFSFGSSLFGDDRDRYKIPVVVFAEFLISTSSARQLGKDFEDMLAVFREILVAGDANRLVSELTSVRIDDLAAPPPVMSWDLIFEPLIGFVILLNGLVIGLQTDPGFENWSGWAWVEATFAVLYAFELMIRIWAYGLCEYYCGMDSWWSYFDTFIVFCAMIDTIFEFFLADYELNMTIFSITRIIRLTRLTRLFRIFRLGFLRELTIMVKGLIAGFRTLLWANVLLFFTIYLIAVMTTFTIGKSNKNPAIANDKLFTTVPRSMLTWFRCFVGDCNTSKGEPIIKICSDSHGITFIIGYVASFTVVTLGLFNLITALYVDIAMAAAKRTEDHDKGRAHRESLRVAHITKRLLKKFCAAQRHIQDPRRMSIKEVSQTLISKSDDQDIDESQTISSELFLLIIQDQEVQRLMNDLDIPPDRANLFDVLDADGTGDLHVTELVHGLLKVRGEARKSDVIASLLAVRAVQGMIRLLEDKMTESHLKIMDHLGMNRRASDIEKKSSIWAVPSLKSVAPSVSFQGSVGSQSALLGPHSAL